LHLRFEMNVSMFVNGGGGRALLIGMLFCPPQREAQQLMASQITTNPKPVNDFSHLPSTAKTVFIQKIVDTV